MKKYKIFSIIILLFSSFVYGQSKDEKAIVYIVIGQSNAAGWSSIRGIISPKIEEFYQTQKDAFMFHPGAKKFIPHYFDNSGGTSKTGEIGGGRDITAPLALLYSKFFPNKKIYFIKFARGGTTIGREHWDIMAGDTNPNSLWSQFKNNCMIPGIKELKDKGLNPEVRGIFWMQGESNANGPAGINNNNTMTIDQYENHLAKLWERLKTEFPESGINKNTKFVVGSISITNENGMPMIYGGKARYSDNVRKAQERLAQKDKQFKVVVNDDATVNSPPGPSIHFNDDDYYEMARKILTETESLPTKKAYVNPNSRGKGNGKTPKDAFNSLAKALELGNDEIYLTGNINENVVILPGVRVIGDKKNTTITGNITLAGSLENCKVFGSKKPYSELIFLGELKNCQLKNQRIMMKNSKLGAKITNCEILGVELDGFTPENSTGNCIYKIDTAENPTFVCELIIENTKLISPKNAKGKVIYFGSGFGKSDPRSALRIKKSPQIKNENIQSVDSTIVFEK